MAVYLGCGSTLNAGQSLDLVANVVHSEDKSSAVPAMSITVADSVDPTVPVPIITGPTYVSLCDSLVLDSSASIGSGGRAFVNYTWAVDSELLVDPTLPTIR